ncbi:sensor domain-containing diguanylate cyclase [Shewanella aestuarii]|uniref:diguanylate cyclase n=1 Tax=Shewanella aestuarii TaxID=1028752 RepID=A0A6G9QPJ1_9GAMM|nr:sensor domain-containing diguanylate cyclase [Shewanella aestuarii]QIR15967.1 diguanylate cyclase [Shewanella aestuarii]
MCLWADAYVGIKDFYFSEYIYSKPFWSVATPENNPTNETVISELYLDAAGKGLMISISTPVYFKDEFKGVVSLDVGLDYLSDVLYSYNSSLNNYASIITKNGVLAANKENIGINEEAIKLDKNTKTYKLTKKTDGYYMLSNLINGRFYLIYQLPNADFTRLVIKSIYGIQIILTLFIVILVLLLNLTKNLIKTKKMAESDGLSQMYNRMTLEKISNEIVDHAQKNDEPVSIIMADIDLFKNLNDQYGHHVGDAGIIHVASMIKQAIRKADIVGRYGGEEFVVTMPNTNIETAKLAADRIRQNIEKSTFYNDKKVTISIGVAEGQDLSAHSFHALCQKADLALYQAKKNGRNCTVKYSPDLENLTSKH